MTRQPHETCPRCHGVIEKGKAPSLEHAIEVHLASCPSKHTPIKQEEKE